jgi:DNA polymerase III sliding clamp (beta) subunit (PCNA family)
LHKKDEDFHDRESLQMQGKANKVWAKLTASLGKIGPDLYFTQNADNMCVSTVSKNNSSFAAFIFDKSLFERYDVGNSIEFKLLAKSFTNMLKMNLQDQTRRVDMDLVNDRVVVDILCDQGVQKHHAFQYEETAYRNAVVSSNYPNSFSVNPKVLLDMLANFPGKVGDIILTMGPEQFTLTTEDRENSQASNSLRSLNTTVRISISDFESYKNSFETSLAVDLKEMKVYLDQCRNCYSLQIHLEYQ